MASKKETFIQDVVISTNGLAKYYTDRSNEIYKSYFDNGYNTSLTDADIQALYPDMTLADFQAAMTLMDQMNNFTGNQPVATGDYAANINRVRITGLV